MPWRDENHYSMKLNPFVGTEYEEDEGFKQFQESGNTFSWQNGLIPRLANQVFFKFIPGGRPQVSVDAGANYGCVSYPLALLSDHVHAFEMRRDIFDYLKINTSKFSNITYHRVALSNQTGQATMFADIASGLSMILSEEIVEEKAIWHKGIRQRQKNRQGIGKNNTFSGGKRVVPTRQLDNFNLKNVDFIKLDVQYHEYEVLEGARNTIVESNPILLLEELGGRGPQIEDYRMKIKDMLFDMGYTIFDIWVHDCIFIHEKHLWYRRNKKMYKYNHN